MVPMGVYVGGESLSLGPPTPWKTVARQEV